MRFRTYSSGDVMRCAGGVEITFRKACPECGAEAGDACARVRMIEIQQYRALLACARALKLAVGNLQGIMDGNDLPSIVITRRGAEALEAARAAGVEIE